MNYLSICAIFKNEAPYLREWVEFHRMQGIEHFYLYNNQSTDDWKQVLNPYEDKGIITLYDWNFRPGQKLAYNHYILNHRNKSVWTAFIDLDEFLFYSHSQEDLPMSGGDGALQDFLKLEEENSVVAVHWWLFGSNTRKDYDPRPVIERFTRKAAAPDQHIKSIVKNSDVIGHGSDVHTFRVRGKIVNENGKELPKEYALDNPATAKYLRINHYHNKSEEEARLRWKEPRADNGQMRDFDKHFAAHDCNDIEDFSAEYYLPELKRRLNNERP